MGVTKNDFLVIGFNTLASEIFKFVYNTSGDPELNGSRKYKTEPAMTNAIINKVIEC